MKTLVQLLTVREVAKQLGVHRATVERLIAAREIPVVRIAGRRRSLLRVDADVLRARVEAWSEEFR